MFKSTSPATTLSWGILRETSSHPKPRTLNHAPSS